MAIQVNRKTLLPEVVKHKLVSGSTEALHESDFARLDVRDVGEHCLSVAHVNSKSDAVTVGDQPHFLTQLLTRGGSDVFAQLAFSLAHGR